MQRKRAGTGALVPLFCTLSCSSGPSTSTLTTVVQSDPGPEALKKARCSSFSNTRNVFFGDLHVHTSYSFDAFGWGTRTDPVGAYAFAKGDSAMLGTERGQPPRMARLERHLDFAAVTDHSDFFGDYPPGVFTGSDRAEAAWT